MRSNPPGAKKPTTAAKLLVPLARVRPMLVAAVVGGLSATLLRNMPLRLGVVSGIVLGIAAGFAAEHVEHRRTGND